jgi:hypothetical protein
MDFRVIGAHGVIAHPCISRGMLALVTTNEHDRESCNVSERGARMVHVTSTRGCGTRPGGADAFDRCRASNISGGAAADLVGTAAASSLSR